MGDFGSVVGALKTGPGVTPALAENRVALPLLYGSAGEKVLIKRQKMQYN
jgi:hypothetical protein